MQVQHSTALLSYYVLCQMVSSPPLHRTTGGKNIGFIRTKTPPAATRVFVLSISFVGYRSARFYDALNFVSYVSYLVTVVVHIP